MIEALRNNKEGYLLATANDFEYIRFTDCALDIDDECHANIHVSMNAKPNADSIRISVNLQFYDGEWITLKHWIQDYIGSYGSINETYTAKMGYEHRIQVYYYAYNGAFSEWLTSIDDGEWC